MHKKILIYPGTFDPITKGHEDLIQRSLKLFDEIVVAVANSNHKQPTITLENRITLAKSVLSKFSKTKIKITRLNGLLVNFAKAHNAIAILRGLRAVSDFDYEFQMAGMNRSLEKNIETIFLTPDEKYTFISSSIVREIVELGGDISKFVSKEVIEFYNNIQKHGEHKYE